MEASQNDFHREFRLGLVLYGGVSLAVYMNGVCREFYDTVRGRGVYKLIKALTDSDVVVDIVSGTSAGGVNGVLLSYALANSNEKVAYDFKNFATIWRESGDISQLLRQVRENDADDVDSILDGETYQKALEKAFLTPPEKAPVDDWFSPFEELDLFVTATDELGKVSRYFDHTGKLIEVNDHRAIFILKHREGRKEPFKPQASNLTQKALAKLCRITSCFPVAFPVVTVKLDEKCSFLNKNEKNAYPDWQIDAELVKWGDLNNRLKPPRESTDNGEYELHFVDGGVLDNRPFGYTIKEIVNRHFFRPVSRKLFYIDPSPDKFLNSSSFKLMKKPTIWQAAMDSLVGLPRYESIVGDLQEIAKQNDQVHRNRMVRTTAVRAFEDELKSNPLPSAAEEPQPHTSSQEQTSQEQIYLRCRLVALRDRVLPLIIGINQGETIAQTDGKKVLLERAAEMLTNYIDNSQMQAERDQFLQQKAHEIHNLDVDYSIRQHYFLLEEIVQSMQVPKYFSLHQNLELLAKFLNRQLCLLDVIKSAIDEMLMTKNVQQDFANMILQDSGTDSIDLRKKVYLHLLTLHRSFLDATNFTDLFDQLSQSLHGKMHCFGTTSDSLRHIDLANQWLPSNIISEKLLYKLRELAKKLKPDESVQLPSLLSAVEKLSIEIITCFALPASSGLNSDLRRGVMEDLLKKFQNFELLDQQVYPFQFLSNYQAQDLIELARISPEDANKGFGRSSEGTTRQPENRLTGLQFGAFGGFFKKSWRSNDLLWGRLDGLNRLVDGLLTPETVKHFPAYLARCNKLEDAKELDKFLSGRLLEILPDVPSEKSEVKQFLADKRTSLHNNLKALAQGDASFNFSALLEQLVEAGQLAILQSDLINVFDDAVAEQFKWNQQLVASKPKKSAEDRNPPPQQNRTFGSKADGAPPLEEPPRFHAIEGYFDKALTPLISKSLVDSSFDKIRQDPQKLAIYFREQYKVGSERLTKDIPPIVHSRLIAQSALVIRGILRSKPTGPVLKQSASFHIQALIQILNFFLNAFNWWVNLQGYSTSSLPRNVLPLLRWILVCLLILGTLTLVNQIPHLVMVLILSFLVLELAYGRFVKVPSKTANRLKVAVIIIGSLLLLNWTVLAFPLTTQLKSVISFVVLSLLFYLCLDLLMIRLCRNTVKKRLLRFWKSIINV